MQPSQGPKASMTVGSVRSSLGDLGGGKQPGPSFRVSQGSGISAASLSASLDSGSAARMLDPSSRAPRGVSGSGGGTRRPPSRPALGELSGGAGAWSHGGMDLRHAGTTGRLTQMHLASPRSPAATAASPHGGSGDSRGGSGAAMAGVGGGLRESYDPRTPGGRSQHPPRLASTTTPNTLRTASSEALPGGGVGGGRSGEPQAAPSSSSRGDSGGGSGGGGGGASPSRPPPAGMRGAFSWGVGPNAYEVDGRPGTRGGGPAGDLEGRPGTRSGGVRPPSRMQSSGSMPPAGTGAMQMTPLMQQQQPSSNSRGRGGGRRVNGNGGGLSSPAPGSRYSPAAAAGATAQGDSGSSRATQQQQQQQFSGPPRQQQQQQGGGRGGRKMTTEGSRRMTSDIDQLIEGMSDVEDDDAPVLGSDLKSYLSTLDVAAGGGGRGNGIKAAKATASATVGSKGGPLPHMTGGQQQQQRGTPLNWGATVAAAPPTPAQPYDPGILPQHQHLPHRAVKAAMQVVDRMVAQAVRSGEVNVLIKQAEASSLAEDEAIGGRVVLDGDNWQEAARLHAGSIKDRALTGLVGAVRLPAAGSGRADLPSASTMPRAPRPDDDFRHLAGGGGTIIPGSSTTATSGSGGSGAAAAAAVVAVQRQPARPAERVTAALPPPALLVPPSPKHAMSLSSASASPLGSNSSRGGRGDGPGGMRGAPMGTPTSSYALLGEQAASPGMSRYGTHRVH